MADSDFPGTRNDRSADDRTGDRRTGDPDRSRWKQIFAIFELALEQPPEARSLFLDEYFSAEDPGAELHRRGVEELLSAHLQQDAELRLQPFVGRDAPPPLDPVDIDGSKKPGEDPATWDSAVRTSAADGESSEPVLGPYVLLRKIGQGGMSTVHLAARRDDAFRRPMVIKVVRDDMENPSMLRRLRVERQILATLEHPYIATLYDGGNTAEGVPYFVMEYVEGQPIDVYCRVNRLSLAERLKLFRKVCEAVQYAHQNLVVHRDIKPSNILVTQDGDPKLLDFGIAKVLDPGSGFVGSAGCLDMELTAPWQRLLTPSFASPEQIRGDAITTVSDVYSLGVLLYLLLTGGLPHSFEGRSLRAIERLLTDEEPVKPSRAVSSGESGEREVNGRRSGGDGSKPGIESGAGVQEPLSGDIDAIILKALRSLPSQRYGSVERFAEDIERFQTGFPVRARAGSRRYRWGKFLRRHRRWVAAVAGVVTLVFLFALSSLLQARRVAFERDKKAQVVSLIQQIFELSDPYVLPGEELTVREALERSLPVIGEGLRDQPEVRAELLHTAGSISVSLGAYGLAKEYLQEALDLRTRSLGRNHPEVAETTRALATAHRQLIELDQAEALALRALELTRNRVGPGHPDLAPALLELISVYCYREQYEAAEPLAQEVLELTQELPEASPLRVAALEYLAQAYSSQGRYAEAAELNRRALALSRQHFGGAHPSQVTTLGNLGVQLRRGGDLEGARSAMEQAIELRSQIFGEQQTDPALLNNLAGIFFASGDFTAAESTYRRALEVVKEKHGERNWMTFSLGLRIARALTHQGRAAEAERQVVALQEHSPLEAGHWMRAEAESILGEAISAQGRCAEAEPMLVGSYRAILDKNRRTRVRGDALERLKTHLVRCGQTERIAAFEALLDRDKE